MRSILVVAGLDPSGGAGFLADARVVADHGMRAVGVVTALTVQDTSGVRASHPSPLEVVGDQLRALLGDVEVDAVKLGMLGDARLADVVADALALTCAPLVWDPVLLPSRGGVPLLTGDVAHAATRLLREARVVTPNLAEAATFAGLDAVCDLPAMHRAAQALLARGAKAVLVKGGHLTGAPIDLLVDSASDSDSDSTRAPLELTGERVDAGPLHGTGCVLATALACGLAAGLSLPDAVRAARAYLSARLRAPLAVGRGARVLV